MGIFSKFLLLTFNVCTGWWSDWHKIDRKIFSFLSTEPINSRYIFYRCATCYTKNDDDDGDGDDNDFVMVRTTTSTTLTLLVEQITKRSPLKHFNLGVGILYGARMFPIAVFFCSLSLSRSLVARIPTNHIWFLRMAFMSYKNELPIIAETFKRTTIALCAVWEC